MITIKEMVTTKEMKAFVKFPFKLYKNNPYWVPPLINGQLDAFDKNINPVFESSTARFFVALKNNEIVGRIVVIINSLDLKEQVNKVRFGWFDFIDDINVSQLLLQKAKEIGKENNLEYMEGPMGFSNLDEVGFLTKGYEEIGTMASWYNFPYYIDHMNKLGFTVEKEYVENRFSFENVENKKLKRVSAMVEKRYGFKPLNFTRTKDVMPYIDEMFDVFNESYASLESFVPITPKQKEYFRKKYIQFINPEFIKFVTDSDDKLIAFAITMPSFSKALQKAKGTLFPFGWYHLLKAKNASKDMLFFLIGTVPKHHNKGVPSIIFNEFYKTFKKLNVKNCIRTPELANNSAVTALWSGFGQETYKRRCTFRKDI
ncbi:GTP cyclohydrolase [Lutibacter holmesii]|uniref:GTP cyclohydrolase n=1 Tax=Lutibacter holmesii TaxID=1137985 RepID=A0ABW3WSV2_9FLAO